MSSGCFAGKWAQGAFKSSPASVLLKCPCLNRVADAESVYVSLPDTLLTPARPLDYLPLKNVRVY